MTDFVIRSLEETSITYDQIVDLLHDSFQERMEQGLHYTCSKISPETFKEKTSDGVVLVALNNNGFLLGTATTHLRIDKENRLYGENEYLAIHPRVKRMGIGSALLKKRLEILENMGAEYVLSDTAINAESAVRYHLKNGFKIVGLKSYTSTNYYSYVFRLQLVRRTFRQRLYSTTFYCKCRYRISSLLIKTLFKTDGTLTSFGQLIKIIRSGGGK